jgi:molybdopterin-binding protein
MRLSARNQLAGTIVTVRRGATTSHVVLDVGGSQITAAITNEAVDELGLAPGVAASAVIKASDVMIGIEDGAVASPSQNNTRRHDAGG